MPNDWLRKASMAMNYRTTSSAWIRGIANALTSQNLDVAALFSEAGLSLDLPENADQRWPTEQVSRLWTLAAEQSGNAAIALTNMHLARPEHYGVVGYAMMSSPDLLTGMGRLERYLHIVSDAASMSLDADHGGRWVRLELFGGRLPVPRQRYEYDLLTFLTFCRWMVGSALKPVAAKFNYPPPGSTKPHDDAFGCPVQFNAKFNGFLVADKDISAKLPTAIPQLADMHDRMARLALLRLGKPATTQRAREAIVNRLQDGAPRRSQIASDLGLSEHTFQRRLGGEGTSFTELVDETRRELAQHHLGYLQTSLSEIVYLLGYSDQSTFFRACLRWFGVSPGEYRSRLSAA
jgi:AraC-like DNA-binding protein